MGDMKKPRPITLRDVEHEVAIAIERLREKYREMLGEMRGG